MNIVDVLDFLPEAWSENTKAKLIVWGSIGLLLLLIGILTFIVSDLSVTVDNQGNDMKSMSNVIDTLYARQSKRDSIDRIKDSTYFHDRQAWEKSEAQKKERWEKWDKDNPKYAPSK